MAQAASIPITFAALDELLVQPLDEQVEDLFHVCAHAEMVCNPGASSETS